MALQRGLHNAGVSASGRGENAAKPSPMVGAQLF